MDRRGIIKHWRYVLVGAAVLAIGRLGLPPMLLPPGVVSIPVWALALWVFTFPIPAQLAPERLRLRYRLLRSFVVGMCAYVHFLQFALPTTAALSSFGHPTRLEQVQSPENLLLLFQLHSEALVKIVDLMNTTLSALSAVCVVLILILVLESTSEK